MKYKCKNLKTGTEWFIDNELPEELEVGKTYKLSMILMPQSEDETFIDNVVLKQLPAK